MFIVLWKWRIDRVFEGKSLTRDFKIICIQAKVTVVLSAFSRMNEGNIISSLEFIRWELPQEGWFVLNTDSSVRRLQRSTGAGGLIWDFWCLDKRFYSYSR